MKNLHKCEAPFNMSKAVCCIKAKKRLFYKLKDLIFSSLLPTRCVTKINVYRSHVLKHPNILDFIYKF